MKRLLITVSMLFVWQAQAQPDAPDAHRMIVTGVVPGPPMWQVKQGENTLWVFGMLDPVPKKHALGLKQSRAHY